MTLNIQAFGKFNYIHTHTMVILLDTTESFKDNFHNSDPFYCIFLEINDRILIFLFIFL